MHLFKSLFGQKNEKEAYLNRLEDLKDDIRRRNDLFDRGPVEAGGEHQDTAHGEWLTMAHETEVIAKPAPKRYELPQPPVTDAGATAADEQLQAILAALPAPKLAA